MFVFANMVISFRLLLVKPSRKRVSTTGRRYIITEVPVFQCQTVEIESNTTGTTRCVTYL